MASDMQPAQVIRRHLILVRPEPPGQYTAQVVSMPGICVTAATEQEAIEQARRTLAEWLATARWVEVEVPTPPLPYPGGENTGFIDPNDPLEQEYLADLARFRQEDLERTLREYDQECPNSSSTPTT